MRPRLDGKSFSWALPILHDVKMHAILLLRVGFFGQCNPKMSIKDHALIYMDSLHINKS